MEDNEDVGFTEEQMIAQAIALSLTPSPQPGSFESQPSRAATNQSIDSVLSVESLPRGQDLRQCSQGTGTSGSGQFSSTSSSPDLGISTGDVSQGESLYMRTGGDGCSGGIASGTAHPDIINESTPCAQPGDLPYARLSSLHDTPNSLDKSIQPRPSHAVVWKPNKECLELIIGMGISENAARRALYYTGNSNAELAIAWVFENINDPNLHLAFEPPPMINSGQSTQFGPGPVYHSFDNFIQVVETYKMVFVVNNSLKMGVGKIAAQVGHATLGLYQFLQGQAEQTEGLRSWEERGSKKVVLRGESAKELLELKRKAYELKVVNIVVHDAGHTQVEPGSLTVLALFGRIEAVNQITGKLKLL